MVNEIGNAVTFTCRICYQLATFLCVYKGHPELDTVYDVPQKPLSKFLSLDIFVFNHPVVLIASTVMMCEFYDFQPIEKGFRGVFKGRDPVASLQDKGVQCSRLTLVLVVSVTGKL